MSFKSGLPVFSSAPTEYSREYMDDVVRLLNLFVSQVNNPGNIRGTNLVLTDLPTSGYLLETGSVYNDDGTLKIVLNNVGYAGAVSGAFSLGTITITTS
jgi:hypothetical protein|tara:strand:+ start:54 stop:350 length:297 start_codon:yes stop_codon:yes gene_type:complete